MEADANTTVDGVARGGRQMSPLLLPVPLAADAGVPGAQAPREEMADPLLLTPPCTVVTGILYLGDWRDAVGDDIVGVGTKEGDAVFELVLLVLVPVHRW